MAEAQTSAAVPPTAAPATPTAAPTPPAAEASKPAAADPRTAQEALAAIQKARKAERELDAARKALAERDKLIAERDPAKLAEKLRTAPWDALIQAFPGMSKADITKALLGSARKPDPQEETAKRLAELSKELAAEKSARTEREQTGRANAVLNHCLQVAKGGGDAYELVAFEMQAEPEKWRAALVEYEKVFPKHDAATALASFEAALLQTATRRASLKKVRALYAPETTDPKAKDKTAKSAADGPRTLTQALASERATPAPGTESRLRSRERSEMESREAAIAAFVAAQKKD